MNRNFKTVLTGAAVAFGLVSTAALAQQAEPVPEAASSQMMMNSDETTEGAMPQGDMMAMMKDPEMRRKMMAMMENCKKMMERMDATSGSHEMPNSPQRQ